MNYKVKTSVKPRKSPSMWETITEDALAVEYTFESNVVVTLVPNPPITGQVGAITWVQLPDGFYVPMVYKGVTYVIEYTPTPSTKKHFNLSVEGYLPFDGDLTPVS